MMATQYVPMLALGFAMLVQTIGLAIWITKSITALQSALDHYAKTSVVAALTARIDVIENHNQFMQRQLDNDKAGRAAFATVSGDVAALKAMMTDVKIELRELRDETRRA